jgi:hypothetical protein
MEVRMETGQLTQSGGMPAGPSSDRAGLPAVAVTQDEIRATWRRMIRNPMSVVREAALYRRMHGLPCDPD